MDRSKYTIESAKSPIAIGFIFRILSYMSDFKISSKLFPLVSGKTNIAYIIPAKENDENKPINPCIPKT